MLHTAFAELCRRIPGVEAVYLFDDDGPIDVDQRDADGYEMLLVVQQLSANIGAEMAAERMAVAEVRGVDETIIVRPYVLDNRQIYCGVRGRPDPGLVAKLDRAHQELSFAEMRAPSVVDDVPPPQGPQHRMPPPPAPESRPPSPWSTGQVERPVGGLGDDLIAPEPEPAPEPEEPAEPEPRKPRYGTYRGVRYRID